MKTFLLPNCSSFSISTVHCVNCVSAEISKHKGPPVFSEEERYRMVRAIKWVDQVYFYNTSLFVEVEQNIL